MTVPDRAAAFLADILSEPDTLTGVLDAYAAPGGPLAALPERVSPAMRVVFVGLGSSRYAALDAAARLRAGGVAAWTEFAGADPGTPPARDLVVVAISASGRTSEVLETIERHRGTSLVLAVTSHPDAPIGADAHLLLPLLAGSEASGIACRSYQATVAVLAMLGDRLSGRLHDPAALRPAADALRTLLQGRDAWLEAAADQFDRAALIDVLAPASLLGLAEQAALMLREAPRLPAHAHETADWLHTAIYLALPGHRALVVPGSPRDAEVERTIRGRGGTTVALGEGTGSWAKVPVPSFEKLPSEAWPLVASAAAELLAAALWQRSGATQAALNNDHRGG